MPISFGPRVWTLRLHSLYSRRRATPGRTPKIGTKLNRHPPLGNQSRNNTRRPLIAAIPMPDYNLNFPFLCRAGPSRRINCYDQHHSQTPLSRRHRFRRLRLRHHGGEAQGVLRPQRDQVFRAGRREQVRPRGLRLRQPVLEEPGHQPFSGLDRRIGVDRRPAGGARPGRENRDPAVRSQVGRHGT